MPRNNFKYSLDFLKRFNALYYQGKPLSHQKIFSKYNVWIFFQTRLFFNDLKNVHQKLGNEIDSRPSWRVVCQNFLLSVFSLLLSSLALVSAILFKKKLLIYSIDRANSTLFSNDARMDPVYKYLKESSASFVEFFHTIFDLNFVQKFFKRKRFAMYMKSIDSLFPLAYFLGLAKRNDLDINKIDLSSFKIEERDYAKFLLSRYLSAVDLVVFRVRILKKVLSWMSLEAVFTIDNTRDYWELVLACRMNNIPVYAFQHGHFTKYNVGWLDDGSFDGEIVHPDKLFVWSDFWKRELLRLGTYFPEESIEVGGFRSPISASSNLSKGEILGVLVPYEVHSIKLEVKKYVDKLLTCENIKIFFKLRTDSDTDRQMNEYGISENYHPNLKIISDIKDCINEISIVAGTYSTFLYDMMVYERPIVILRTPSDFGDGMLLNNLAEEVNMENLCEKILEISKTPESVLKGRREILFGKESKLMYDSVKRLAEELQL